MRRWWVAAALAAWPVLLSADIDLLQAANSAYREQRPAEAASLYREYLKGHADRADVRIFLGASLLALDQRVEALAEARRAIELEPGSARAHTLAGRVHAAGRQWEPAQGAFAQAVLLAPQSAEPLYFSGRAYYEASQFEQAVHQLRRAAALGAQESRVQEYLGLSLEAVKQFDEARRAYELAVRAKDAGWHASYVYGLFLFKQSELEKAEPALRVAYELRPEDRDVRFALARVLYHAGRLEEAAKVLSGAAAGKDCRSHYLLLRVYAAQGEKAAEEREVALLPSCVPETTP